MPAQRPRSRKPRINAAFAQRQNHSGWSRGAPSQARGTVRQETSLRGGRDTSYAVGLSSGIRMEQLDNDERVVVQRVVNRLVEERQTCKAGRTFWSILNRMAGMSQVELDKLVDIYYAPESRLAKQDTVYGSGAVAAECSVLERASEAALDPVSGCRAESGVQQASGAGDFVEPETLAVAGPDEAAGPDDASPLKADSVAVYCQVCVIWLNGPKQYESHSIGRKHRKRERDRSRGKTPASSASACDGIKFQ